MAEMKKRHARARDQINQFERELEEHGMQINNITMSAAIDGGSDEYALYGIVQDSQKLAENKPSIT
ncbi:MAG: hypothetical protein ACRD42_01665 [Nitrososphaeraceae archaeon]